MLARTARKRVGSAHKLLLLVIVAAAAAPAARALRPAAAAAATPLHTASGPDDTPQQPPLLPESYTVNYTLTLPYTASYQPHALSYAVFFARDDHSGSLRLDVGHSANVLISHKGHGAFELVPRIDRQVCLRFKHAGDSSIEATALPDVRGWEYGGKERLNGEQVQLWQYEARHEAKRVVYRFYATTEGVPRRLDMRGQNSLSGAHLDHWVNRILCLETAPRQLGNWAECTCAAAANCGLCCLLAVMLGGSVSDATTCTLNLPAPWQVVDYTHFFPSRPAASLFHTPELCKSVAPQTLPTGRRTARQTRLLSLVPTVRYRGDTEYDAFLSSPHGIGRSHASLADYERRAALFRANLRMIEAHNAANRSFTMAMNRFGDWTRDEFVALMLPKRGRMLQRAAQRTQQEGKAPVGEEQQGRQATAAQAATQAGASSGEDEPLQKHQLPYEPVTPLDRLPESVSWRGAFPVQDQANCGSCWTFASAGAMEAAWWRATGQRTPLSQQQILDCSWGTTDNEASNMACDGGDPWAAIAHVVDSGGIATLADYQYEGLDNYCRANRTRQVGRFKGWARPPRYNNAALMEAVYSRGPLAISFDASRPSFAFYSSGVYVDTECLYKPEDLDHSMVLVGYGSSEAGDYWEVKNSWSTHWGDGGHFKVLRDGHACGVASDAAYAVVADGVL